MTDFNESMRQLAAPILELVATHQAGWDDLRELPIDHAARRDWLRLMSEAVRKVSDALTAAEEAAKTEAPPACDLRVRESTARPGTLTELDDHMAGWLVLAAKGGHVLEVWKHGTEWAHEAEARFHRACSESPADTLAKMLASGSEA